EREQARLAGEAADEPATGDGHRPPRRHLRRALRAQRIRAHRRRARGGKQVAPGEVRVAGVALPAALTGRRQQHNLRRERPRAQRSGTLSVDQCTPSMISDEPMATPVLSASRFNAFVARSVSLTKSSNVGTSAGSIGSLPSSSSNTVSLTAALVATYATEAMR